jgi:hypothetical protein
VCFERTLILVSTCNTITRVSRVARTRERASRIGARRRTNSTVIRAQHALVGVRASDTVSGVARIAHTGIQRSSAETVGSAQRRTREAACTPLR